MEQTDKDKQRQWQGHTGGGSFGQKALVIMLRIVPLRVIYGLLALVVPFYMLFAHKGYKAIYHYFRQHFGLSPIKAFGKTYKNHFIFGQVVIDRFAIFAGRKDDYRIEVENYDIFDALNRSAKGFVTVSAHIGNYEISGYMLQSDTKRLNALVYSSETEIVTENRTKLMGGNNIRLIPVRDDMSHIFEVSTALQNGDIISSVVDRINGSGKSLECHFLNGVADFPIGLFALAASFEVEVLAVFTLKVAANKYKTIIRRIDTATETSLSKRQKIEKMTHSYISHIEDILHQYPEQWFNFYEFWKQ